MRCSEPGHRALVAIHASHGPGRSFGVRSGWCSEILNRRKLRERRDGLHLCFPQPKRHLRGTFHIEPDGTPRMFMESPLCLATVHWDHEPSPPRPARPRPRRQPTQSRTRTSRTTRRKRTFMESPLSVFFRMHWDHEPETRKPFRIKASVFRFMESRPSRALGP